MRTVVAELEEAAALFADSDYDQAGADLIEVLSDYLGQVVEAWDVLEDGVEVPPTADVFAQLPAELLLHLVSQIAKDRAETVPFEEESGTTATGSSSPSS